MSDRLLDALADGQRRRIVLALAERNSNDTLAVADVVEGHARETLGARLRHVHLPKLADVGVVEWDRTSDEIARGPRFDDARRLLRLAFGSRRDGASADA